MRHASSPRRCAAAGLRNRVGSRCKLAERRERPVHVTGGWGPGGSGVVGSTARAQEEGFRRVASQLVGPPVPRGGHVGTGPPHVKQWGRGRAPTHALAAARGRNGRLHVRRVVPLSEATTAPPGAGSTRRLAQAHRSLCLSVSGTSRL
jgi:hypothetical protein